MKDSKNVVIGAQLEIPNNVPWQSLFTDPPLHKKNLL